MIRISSVNRKVDPETGAFEDVTCMTILVAGNDTNFNKARFRLTVEESRRFDALTRDIEKRVGESVLAPAYSSGQVIESEAIRVPNGLP